MFRSRFAVLAAALAMTALLPVGAHAQATPPAAPSPQFIGISPDALLSTAITGLTVRNAQGEELGKVEDLAFEGGELAGVVLSVAAAAGPRYVALDPAGISVRYDEASHTWTATVNATPAELAAAPAFQYSGKWKR